MTEINDVYSDIDPDEVLKNFMLEFFDFNGLKKAGIYKGLKKKDYKGQAERVCEYFGYKTVYEYGSKEIRCHVTAAGDRSKNDPFITILPNIYES